MGMHMAPWTHSMRSRMLQERLGHDSIIKYLYVGCLVSVKGNTEKVMRLAWESWYLRAVGMGYDTKTPDP